MIHSKTRNGYSVNIPCILNQFEFIRILGIGSSSIVFLVKDRKTFKQYSAKIIPKSYIKKNKLINRIEKEIAILEETDHPNIVKIYQTFEIVNKHKEAYIAILMEYCANGDLLKFIQDKGFKNEKQKFQIIRGFLSAMKYLHERGISHGDIKPENILLDSNFNAKLCDFGYCKTTLIAGDNEKGGTIFYAAPEMFNDGEFNPLKSDIWSIGILLYCISENGFPYLKGTTKYLTDQITSGRLFLSSKINKNLRKVVKRCTELKSERRPSIEELMEDNYFPFNEKISNLKMSNIIEKLGESSS